MDKETKIFVAIVGVGLGFVMVANWHANKVIQGKYKNAEGDYTETGGGGDNTDNFFNQDYITQSTNKAVNELVAAGWSESDARGRVMYASDHYQPFEHGELLKEAPPSASDVAIGSLVIDNPIKGIEWYNPFSWSFK